MTETPFNAELHPRCQPRLIGHETVYEKLQQSFQSGTMPPAWLLTGEKGIGKATLAYRFARFVLAQDQPDPSIIDRQVIANTYPNLLTIERQADEDGKMPQEISVDQARKVGHFLRQSPAIPGWRVVIIDAASELNRNAANSLLKALEEPPAKTLLLLIAHSLGQVLPTIRSRCCQLSLQPLDLKRGGDADLVTKVNRAIGQAVQGQYAGAQAFAASIPKADPSFGTILDTIESSIHQFMVKGPGIPEDLSKLAGMRPTSHWVDVRHRLHTFFSLARTSHLDQTHVLMAAFFIIENPQVGEDFAHGTPF